jgi:hypothetical protein
MSEATKVTLATIAAAALLGSALALQIFLSSGAAGGGGH